MFSGLMINTWVVATIVATVAGCVGFFVVIRGASFAAHTLPLGAFPGAAAASLLGVNPLLGLAAFSFIGVLGISQLSRRGRPEAVTALCLVTLLGSGALFLSMTSEYSQEVYALLFGELPGVSNSDLACIAIMSLVAIAVIALLFRPLLLTAMSAELAEAMGVSGKRMDLWFLGVLALSTSMALPLVGALLVFSLMVGPASAARSLSDRPVVALFLSVGIAMVTVWLAIALSYESNWPVGFFVGALGAVSYALGRLVAGRGRRSDAGKFAGA